jgi:hypothetical protein
MFTIISLGIIPARVLGIKQGLWPNPLLPIIVIGSTTVGHRESARSNVLKVHKRENFLGFDFEICTFS